MDAHRQFRIFGCYWRDVSAIAENCYKMMPNHDVEHMISVGVRNDRVIGAMLVASGTRDTVSFDVRDALTWPAFSHCEKMIMVHNHPESFVHGIKFPLHPSNADLLATVQVARLSSVIGIGMEDHLVIDSSEVFSIRQKVGLG